MIIAAMMVVAVRANAQFEPGTFSIQPKIGGTISMMSNMPNNIHFTSDVNYNLADKSPITGFIIGAEFEHQISKRFSLAAGLYYSKQGCGWENHEENHNNFKDFKFNYKIEFVDAKIDLGYINLPLVANVYLFKGFAIKTGVQIGFLTDTKVKFNVNLSSKDQNYYESINYNSSIKNQCEKFDISIPVGLSYQVPTIPIYIDSRVNFGLKKVNKDKTLMIEGIGGETGSAIINLDKDLKNLVFQLTVGYKFAL